MQIADFQVQNDHIFLSTSTLSLNFVDLKKNCVISDCNNLAREDNGLIISYPTRG